MKLIEITNSAIESFKEVLEGAGAENISVYNMDTGCNVMYSVENGREHVSISHRHRDPRWDEIKYVRYKLMKSDITVAQILPPMERYVNVHEHCFHLWEVKDDGISLM